MTKWDRMRVLPILVESLEAARQTGDADLITEAMWAVAFNRYYAAQIDEMRRLLEEAHEHVKRTGSTWAGLVLLLLGRSAVYQGDLTSASNFVEEAIAALRTSRSSTVRSSTGPEQTVPKIGVITS